MLTVDNDTPIDSDELESQENDDEVSVITDDEFESGMTNLSANSR
jgi:hypothetical protein